MSTKFPSAVRRYCKAKKQSQGTSDEYKATVRKWVRWGQDLSLEHLSRSTIKDFLEGVYDDAVKQGGQNPERTSNKARDHVRAVAAWAWENDIIESLPRFTDVVFATVKQAIKIQSNPSERSKRRMSLLERHLTGVILRLYEQSGESEHSHIPDACLDAIDDMLEHRIASARSLLAEISK